MVGFEPLERLEFESVALAADFPPVLRDRNKQAVHSICCPEGCVHKKAGYSVSYSQQATNKT